MLPNIAAILSGFFLCFLMFPACVLLPPVCAIPQIKSWSFFQVNLGELETQLPLSTELYLQTDDDLHAHT